MEQEVGETAPSRLLDTVLDRGSYNQLHCAWSQVTGPITGHHALRIWNILHIICRFHLFTIMTKESFL